ncbi:hypothetical protein N0V88_007837 [Collariella sp. IMI 366227]|nr:hypothetical protein N0V88_007837 [Collariella sp. IMI 366227]
MRLPTFLSLLGTTAAIDIWLDFSNTSGNSGSISCVGLDKYQCCAITGRSDSPFKRVSVKYIPTNWDVVFSGHAGPQCGRILREEASAGRTAFDFKDLSFGGSGYHFGPGGHPARSEGVGAYEVVRPSIVALADGTQYNVTKLDDAAFNEMFVYIQTPQRTFSQVVY